MEFHDLYTSAKYGLVWRQGYVSFLAGSESLKLSPDDGTILALCNNFEDIQNVDMFRKNYFQIEAVNDTSFCL